MTYLTIACRLRWIPSTGMLQRHATGHRLHVGGPGHGWCPEQVVCPRQVGRPV